MKTTLGILLGVMLAGIGTAQAGEQGTAAKPKPKAHAKQKVCTEAKAAFIETFSQLVSTFREQVELAEATPRVALSQRVADLQKTALELKSASLPACVLASGVSHLPAIREALALKMEMAVAFSVPGDLPERAGGAAATMVKAVHELQTSDDEIEATCRGLAKEKAIDLRLQVWKSDANTAAKFEIKRFLTFMKHSPDEAKPALEGTLYSLAAQNYWHTHADGRHD